MKKTTSFTLALGLSILSTPAFADELSDTVTALKSNGAMLSVQGQELAIAYAEDGTFDVGPGMFTGTYTASGSNICITIPGMADNQCTSYPDGKKPGDTFDVESEMGPMTVTISQPKAE